MRRYFHSHAAESADGQPWLQRAGQDGSVLAGPGDLLADLGAPARVRSGPIDRGQLRIYLGYAPGVGTTCALL
jgi:hypothetical protein